MFKSFANHPRGTGGNSTQTRALPFIVISVITNDGDRDNSKGSSMDTDNNRDSTGMRNNMVQGGVADGIP